MAIGTHQHAQLMDPVNRSSMWRKGYNTPENFEDTQLFCGGFKVQWYENDGKCGECGDDYALKRPRPNENGGIFGTGIIVAKYPAGSTITTLTNVTANHLGRLEFRLCPLKLKDELETEECFAKYPLKLADGSSSHRLVADVIGDVLVDVVLPDIKCEQCVLQWTYITGNSWGYCGDGTGALGCGPQETFRGCSDISLV
uniref:Lytic polysaccharide monooxygenase D n=1 Tax=Coptotermes gestroi TaxID=232242 RepID=A0A896IJL0_9NEOP|nr:lytic polysaccharide monooxygenase D [Coptotermes gestroi]